MRYRTRSTFSEKMTRKTMSITVSTSTQTGSGSDDLMGLSKQQVINDVLERYEAHTDFLTLSSETDILSASTSPTG